MATDEGWLDKYLLPGPPKRARGRSAAKWAGTGAAIGTAIMPGWGTAIGAGIGGLGGILFGGESEEDKQQRLSAMDELRRRQQLQELLMPMAEGQITPVQQSSLNLIRNRYEQASRNAGRQLGAGLGRRGLTASPMAAGMQARLAQNYGQASLDAIARQRNAWQQAAIGQLAGITGQAVPQMPQGDDEFWGNFALTMMMLQQTDGLGSGGGSSDLTNLWAALRSS